MRIAMISDCYAPRLGGIETLVEELSAQLAARGDDVDILTATVDPSNTEPAAPRSGMHILRITSNIPLQLPVARHATSRIADVLGARRPDVVIVHCGILSPFAFAGANAALDLGIPTIVIWHCTLGTYGARFMRATRLPATWQRRGAVLAAVSNYAAGWVKAAGGRDVHVLANAIDAPAWAHPDPHAACQRLQADTPGRQLQVVSAIRLTKEKRPEVLIKAFLRAENRARTALQTDQPVAQLTIFGDGPKWASLQALISRFHLQDRVQLAGRTSRQELAARYHQADIYLTARLDEAFGISPLEARAAGLAVVGRAGTGMDDFITDGVNGLVADDDAQLADQLARLMSERELLAKIRCHNLCKPPRQVWPEILARWDALIDQARA